jgi:hypothetical protein
MRKSKPARNDPQSLSQYYESLPRKSASPFLCSRAEVAAAARQCPR